VVYLATDKIFGGPKVAIKLLDPRGVDNVEYLIDLLTEEAKLQAKLSTVAQPHKNIVYLIDVRSFDEDIGIAMEYVDGGSVNDLLFARSKRTKTPLSASRALEIALQVCEGLASAHDIGIIHRDIKPRNIMIGKSDGTVKITDWGVAKNIEKAGIATSFVGT